MATTILRSVSLLNHEGTLSVPSPLSEVIGVEAVEQEAFNNLLYRGILPKLRKQFITGLAAATGLSVQPLPGSDGKKFPTDAKAEADLLKQWVDSGKSQAEFNVLGDSIATKVFSECDVATTLRSLGSGGSIGKDWLEQADTLMVRVQTERDGDYSRFIAAMRTKVPTASLDDESSPSRECIAQILKAYQKALQAESVSY